LKKKVDYTDQEASQSPEVFNANRIHYNTIENYVIFLPNLWLFAFFSGNDFYAFCAGCAWFSFRILYLLGFPKKRGTGFGLSLLTQFALGLSTIYFACLKLLENY